MLSLSYVNTLKLKQKKKISAASYPELNGTCKNVMLFFGLQNFVIFYSKIVTVPFLSLFLRSSLCLDEKRNKCAFLTEKTFPNSLPFSHPMAVLEKANRTLSFRIFEIPSLNFIISFLWIREYPGNLQPRSFQ